MKKVGIITINWNGLDDTIECVNSLLEQQYKNIEIIIVDNNSKNQEGSILLEKYNTLENVTLILNKTNRGFAGGCNDGIIKAMELGCDYYLLFNNDAVASRNFLGKLLEVGEGDETIGIIGPGITYYKSDILRFAGGIIGEWSGIFRHKRKGKDKSILSGLQPYDTEYITGCCMMIKKELLDKQGLLDEEYFAYYEEADYCYKARKSGWRCVVVPSATIEHKKSASVGVKGSNKLSEKQAYLIGRNSVLFGKKNLKNFQKYVYLLNNVVLKFSSELLLNIRSYNVFKNYLKGIINQ